MKKVKILLAMLVGTIAFGVTSYASEFSFDKEITHDGEKAIVNVYVDKDTDLVGFGQDSAIILKVGSGLSYSDDYSNTELYSSPYANTEFYDEDGIVWYVGKDITAWNADTNLLFTVVLAVEDAEGDLTVAFDEANSYAFDTNGTDYTFEAQTVTIKAAGPVGPNPGDIKTPATVISGNKKYSEVYDSNLNARVVFEENIGAQTVTADSVLKAKYLNDTHVANIFELLGITGDGEVEFTSFTVKMVLPAGTAVTDDFSFQIQ